ncbi:MAG TPA: flagellar basal-body MS-ring/collar protein FliF [Bryobacteraceae bacterium]|jgi:flagellar M-ring protein FliF|nr:flagellar basal-body MS-ring/collar protein FliF [Bryobacteraceae bacterium]
MDQFRKLISGLSLLQQVSILAVAALVVGGLVTFSHYRHEGDFRPLYSGMAPEDAATVVQKLKESAVEYRLNDNGATVLVPSAKLAESRLALAAAGLPKSGRIGFELFDKNNFGATEFVEHINYQRALEGELERSVMSLAEVEEARVHLTLPKDSVFIDQQEPAKASVMVKLKPGAQISTQNVVAVTNLVASAVQGLAPEAVSLVDMDGNLLSKPRKAAANDGSEITAESLEVRQQIEHALVNKINATLEPLLGANRFRAGASVDCDLTSGEQQEETLDPSKSVMVSSQKTEEGADHPVAGGVPGTASNLPNPPAPQNKTNGIARRTENITYQTSRTVRTTRIPQGVVRRMSLAVLVDQTVQWDGDGANRKKVLVPPTPETLKTIRDLVAGVTGFDEQRGDQLIVDSLPFESSLNAQPPPSNHPTSAKPAVKQPPILEFYNKYRDLMLPAAVGMVLLIVLIAVVFRTIRKPKARPGAVAGPGHELQPGSHGHPSSGLPVVEGAAAHLDLSPQAQQLAAGPQISDAERDQLAERVRVVVKRDPAATANVLRMWLQDNQS